MLTTYQHKTHPIKAIVGRMNVFFYNFESDELYKSFLAKDFLASPETWERTDDFEESKLRELCEVFVRKNSEKMAANIMKKNL
jgi:hypothetical protein